MVDPQERWNRIRTVFLEVGALPESDRDTRLRHLCAGDDSLLAEVRSLLAAGDTGALRTGQAAIDALNTASTGATPPAHDAPQGAIGPYKLLQRIGEGGFGIVYMADQAEPVRRRVALKIIKPGMDSRQVLARFEAERQALALMDHPHIARVIDGGVTDPALPGGGRPYFVMDYVAGDPINTFAAARGLTIDDRLSLFIQVCEAVHHAHTKGVIHRDIKPSNILVTMTDGRPFARVIDFGIAKSLARPLTDKTLFTEHRQLIGTPEYMSPEQAEGSPDIDTRTDVYGLGVVLYELLTGGTPFDAARLRSAAFAEMQRIIKEEEPVRPSMRLTRNPSGLGVAAPPSGAAADKVRGDLDWIVMKALDKDRARRYESPLAFARDIRRHLDGDAVEAAPPSIGYRLRKFYRRNRVATLAAGAVALALLVGIAGTAWGWRTAVEANASLRRQAATAYVGLTEMAGEYRGDLDDAALSDAIASAEAIRTEEGEWYLRAVIDEARQYARDLRESERLAVAERDRAELSAYAANLIASDACLIANDPIGARSRLDACPDAMRGWEWRFQSARADSSMSSSPANPWLKRAGAKLSPDGLRIAVPTMTNAVRILDAQSHAQVLDLEGHSGHVNQIAWSADSVRIATASEDGDARIWVAATGEPIAAFHADPDAPVSSEFNNDGAALRAVALSLDGTRISAGNYAGQVWVWDVETGSRIVSFRAHDIGLQSIDFSPDGSRLTTASIDATAVVWDASTGARIATVRSAFGFLSSARFDPDGVRIVTGGWGGVARVWDASSGDLISEFHGPQTFLVDAAFSADGRRIVAQDWEGASWEWDVWISPNPRVVRVPGEYIGDASWDPTGRRIATTNSSGDVCVWDADTGSLARTLLGNTAPCWSVSFDPTGGRILSPSIDGRFQVWSAETGELLLRFQAEDPAFLGRDSSKPWQTASSYWPSAWYSDDGTRIITRSPSALNTKGQVIEVHDAATGERLSAISLPRHSSSSIVHTPDRALLASLSEDSFGHALIRVMDLRSGVELATHPEPSTAPRSLEFSPDGSILAVVHFDGSTTLLDPAQGSVLRSLEPRIQLVTCAAWSADGSRFVLGGTSGTMCVWDVASGAVLTEMRGHTDQVLSIGFSPDQSRILSTSDDLTARVWDAETGTELAVLRGHDDDITAEWSPDGSRILTTDWEMLRIWDSQSPRDIIARLAPANP